MEGIGQKPESVTEEAASSNVQPADSDAIPATNPVDMDSAADGDMAPDKLECPSNMEPLGKDSTHHSKPMDSIRCIEATDKKCTALMQPMNVESTHHQYQAGNAVISQAETSAISGSHTVVSSGGSHDAVMASVGDSDDDAVGGTSTGHLPDEILEHLLTFVLPYDDMQSCKLVSRRWYHAVKRE